MPPIKKSTNSICRVWSGPWKVGQKDNKKKVGVNVAINIRAGRMKDFSEETFVREVSELLIKYAENTIQRDETCGSACHFVVF